MLELLILPLDICNFYKKKVKNLYAASKFKGLNDKIGADNAAVDVMRKELNKIDMIIYL